MEGLVMTKIKASVIVKELFHLHQVRKEMSYSSIYHGVYEGKCIALNQDLLSLTGKNYTEFSSEEIENMVIEAELLSPEEVSHG